MAEENIDPIYTTYGAPVVLNQPQGITTPATEFLSAYQPIVFDVTWAGSSETLITNKRVKAELFYGSTPVSLATQTKTSITSGGSTVYRFDFSQQLQTVLSPEFFSLPTNDTITTGNENIVSPFYVDFTAYFRDQFKWERVDNTLTSSTYYVCNTIIQADESNKIIDKGTSPYIADSSSSQFLTKAPNNQVIYSGEMQQLSFITAESDSALFQYQTYNLAGVPNSETTKATVDCTSSKYGTITISDNGVNTIIDDFANISKVDVWIENTSNTEITEKRTYLISQDCTDGYRLAWHNSLGGVDRYTFRAFKNESYVLDERVTIDTPYNTTISVTDFKKRTIATKGNKRYIAESEFIPGSKEMFVDLINSTEVYMDSGSQLIPVNVLSDECTLIDSDGLIKVIIEFELSQGHITHIK